jgi:hypothetical protein
MSESPLLNKTGHEKSVWMFQLDQPSTIQISLLAMTCLYVKEYMT